MRKFISTFLLLSLILPGLGDGLPFGLDNGLQAQSLAHTREARIAKGVNLSNWLEAYWLGGNWPEAARYDKQDLRNVKDAGMQTIRLPFCFAIITDSIPPYNVDFAHPAIAWLDSVIQWCDELQLNLIIDNQHEWDVTNDNFQDKIPPMSSMWRQVVTRYANLDPERYFFEILNEPPVGVLPANADAVNLACIDTIRKYDQSHTLIVGSHSASIGSSYLNQAVYPDTNLIYTFHTYEPLYFTHQGFPWFQIPFPAGTPFPLLGDDALVRSSLQTVDTWRTTNNRPVFMGEFGVGIHADAGSRCNWVNLMGDLIDEFDFNWCYWDWGGVAPSDFSMFNSIPPDANSIVPCFSEALHLYGFTDVGQENFHSWLQIWPNPAGDVLHVQSTDPGIRIDRVEVIDLNGRVLKVLTELPAGKTRLDLSSLPSGSLILKAEDAKGRVSRLPWIHIK